MVKMRSFGGDCLELILVIFGIVEAANGVELA